jgi:hypothetical protein
MRLSQRNSPASPAQQIFDRLAIIIAPLGGIALGCHFAYKRLASAGLVASKPPAKIRTSIPSPTNPRS